MTEHPQQRQRDLDNTNPDYQQGRCDQLVDMMNYLINQLNQYKKSENEAQYNAMMFVMMELHAEFGPKNYPEEPPDK